MKFAYLVAQDIKIIDSGIIEVESISLFFDNYVKKKAIIKTLYLWILILGNIALY